VMTTRVRAMWQLLEPIHALSYFAPESVAAIQGTGLRGYWMSYFAARAAPMGEVSAAVVEATFYNFSPRLVRRAIPDAWSFASPGNVLAARNAGVTAALANHVPSDLDGAAAQLADLLALACEGLNVDGRTLAAANLALPIPKDARTSLWQWSTTLREHRGDGHLSALVDAELSGLEAHLTLVGTGSIPRSVLQGARGFTDEEWDAAERGLIERGLLQEDHELSTTGRVLREDVEATTDRLASQPWTTLGDDRCSEIVELASPIVQSIAASGVVPVLNPMGLPQG
jgi:hypothetical protein